MGQTVFDVGDPITSRLKLGVGPDITTVVTIDVYRPDGTAITDPTISAFGTGSAADEKTAKFYATNTGVAGAATDAADGDWLVVWKVVGTGEGVQPKIYQVRALPEASDDRPAWAPFLSDVADHAPWLTIDTTSTSATHLGTWTGNTWPTDEQAQRHIDQAVSFVAALAGTVAEAHYPLARHVASLRAAAAIIRAYPRPGDTTYLAAADALDKRAEAELQRLVTANAVTADTDDFGFDYVDFDPLAWARAD